MHGYDKFYPLPTGNSEEPIYIDYDLYKSINKRPGYSIYELAKLMGWSSGKVYVSVQRLEKEGLVHTEKDI
ncbi:MAG: winged helix-turn-helix domain-containing protein [Methanothrix sp.]|nr:winged helix-turn-helix domain-containing protein [Methanothrix sp.]